MNGVFPALVTPLTNDGRLAQKALRQLVELHLDAGVNGFYVGGNTGEGLLLDRQARAELFDQVVSGVDGRAQVIAHVGAMTTDEACFLAHRAAEAGADAISAMPPLIYKVDFDSIRAYYQAIADAAEIPLFIYYIPALTSVNFSLDQILQLADEPNITGIKFSDYNLYLMQQLRAERPDFEIFSGNDEIFLAALVMGAQGSIGLTLSFMPELFVAIYKAFQRCDFSRAQELQFQANRFIRIVIAHGVFASGKAILGMRGIDCGPLVRPLPTLDEAAQGQLRDELQAAGFFDAIADSRLTGVTSQ